MTVAQSGARTPTVTVAVYLDYASARRAVDYLSDNGFPVEQTAIVGTTSRAVHHARRLHRVQRRPWYRSSS